MALINCADCEKKISDSSESCPGCGAPTKNSILKHQNKMILDAAVKQKDAAVKQEKLDLPLSQALHIQVVSFFWFFITFALLNFFNALFMAFVFSGNMQFRWTFPLLAMIVGTAALGALLNSRYKLKYVDSKKFFFRKFVLCSFVYLASFILPILAWIQFGNDVVGYVLFFFSGLFQLLGCGSDVGVDDDLEKVKPD